MILSNGRIMPMLIQGLSLMARADMQIEEFTETMRRSLTNGVHAFDTSHAYGHSEMYIGQAIERLTQTGDLKRDDFFITTKIDNEQQTGGDIERCVDNALNVMKLDYLDCVLLHWPVPDIWTKNWEKLINVYKSGKVHAIGIANIQERHIKQLLLSDVEMLPHVVQFEYHPFRTVPDLKAKLEDLDIKIQAYTSLLSMIPMLRENVVLKQLALKYNVTIPAIVLRWDVQSGIAPIFRAYTPHHLMDILKVVDFKLSAEDMQRIDSLNINYKFHPESVNCPGY